MGDLVDERLGVEHRMLRLSQQLLQTMLLFHLHQRSWPLAKPLHELVRIRVLSSLLAAWQPRNVEVTPLSKL